MKYNSNLKIDFIKKETVVTDRVSIAICFGSSILCVIKSNFLPPENFSLSYYFQLCSSVRRGPRSVGENTMPAEVYVAWLG